VHAPADAESVASDFERQFAGNGWPPDWRDVIYGYPHYHTTTHEALGIARGSARVQLGGATGPVFELGAGDVLVLPAGVTHEALERSIDLLVVGAYPGGRDWDMREPDDDPEQARARIAAVPVPDCSPLGDRPGAWWSDSGPGTS